MNEPIIHFAGPATFDTHLVCDACGSMSWGFGSKNNLPAHLTLNPDQVTCKRCQRTDAHKNAMLIQKAREEVKNL